MRKSRQGKSKNRPPSPLLSRLSSRIRHCHVHRLQLKEGSCKHIVKLISPFKTSCFQVELYEKLCETVEKDFEFDLVPFLLQLVVYLLVQSLGYIFSAGFQDSFKYNNHHKVLRSKMLQLTS